ncbi:MAG: ATP-grasp domain-containing protein [Vicinamibacterales bacterium]|nr:ATP-grasp domain-containing protein [Vicinamibacterales bacterium]
MKRLLLLATTTGYQTRMFGEAAARLGVTLQFATDRCDHLDDPWRDGAIPIRFAAEDASVAAIVDAVRTRPIDGILTVGDAPVVIAAKVAGALGLAGHPPEAAATSCDKRRLRERLRAAGLPVPWFTTVPLDTDPGALLDHVPFPCVVKPIALSGSRGVMRADDAHEFMEAYERLRRLLRSPDVEALGDLATRQIQVERYIEGDEFALEGVLTDGRLQTFAVFDKPEPLVGPFFEETIYVTPSRVSPDTSAVIVRTIEEAIGAVGLHHGPVHAECRVGAKGCVLLEVAARPIGGLCARALRFEGPAGEAATLEEVLLRHALGEPVDAYTRETAASGVMMIPIPRGGVYRRVEGVDEAAAVAGVDEVRITAKPDQRLVPLPEGASYLGFIFARGGAPADVERALGEAHRALRFTIDPHIPVH